MLDKSYRKLVSSAHRKANNNLLCFSGEEKNHPAIRALERLRSKTSGSGALVLDKVIASLHDYSVKSLHTIKILDVC